MAGLGRGLGALLSASSRKAKHNNTSGDASSFGIVARSLAQVQGVKEQRSPTESKTTSKLHGQASALNNLLSTRTPTDSTTKSLKSRQIFKPVAKDSTAGQDNLHTADTQEVTKADTAPTTSAETAVAAKVSPTPAPAPEITATTTTTTTTTITPTAYAQTSEVEITPAATQTNNPANGEQELIPQQTYTQGSAFYEPELSSTQQPNSNLQEGYAANYAGQDAYAQSLSDSSNLYIYEHTTYDVEFEDAATTQDAQTDAQTDATAQEEQLFHGDGLAESNYAASPSASGTLLDSGENLEFATEQSLSAKEQDSTEQCAPVEQIEQVEQPEQTESAETMSASLTTIDNAHNASASEVASVAESVNSASSEDSAKSSTHAETEVTEDISETTAHLEHGTAAEGEMAIAKKAKTQSSKLVASKKPQAKQDATAAKEPKLAPALIANPQIKANTNIKVYDHDAAYHDSPEGRSAVQSGSAIDQNLVREIEVSSLQASVYQPRTYFSERSLNELAESIREHGLLEPLLVSRKSRYSKRFEIICGERRFRAAQMAGLTTVPCLVREFSDEKAYAVALIENIQREDLSPLEIARAYEQMMHECDYTQDELAKYLGKSRSTIANTLRLLRLEPQVQQALIKGEIDVGHAKILLALSDKDQINACKTVVTHKLSVAATDVLVKDILKKIKLGARDGSKVKSGIPRFNDYEKYLNRSLQGVKAKFVIKSESKGRLTLSYESDSELKYLLQLLGIPEQNKED